MNKIPKTQAKKSSAAKKSPAAPDAPAAFKNTSINILTQIDEASIQDKEAVGRAVAEATARTLTRPEVTAAAAIECWQKDTHDVNALVTELNRQVEAVNGGDMRRAEAMLFAQAHTLDQIFMNLARRAVKQEYLKQWETYMRMAMKAQSQCRMTLESLATLKNPQVVFARQANINNGGQQQVNNGAASDVASRARESEPEPSKPLEKQDGEWLDTRTEGSASGANQTVAAVGAVIRTEDAGR